MKYVLTIGLYGLGFGGDNVPDRRDCISRTLNNKLGGNYD